LRSLLLPEGSPTIPVAPPSGKSKERNLLDEKILNNNLLLVQKQLENFLDFDCGENSAEIVNNYDWIKEFSFLDFIRDVGKHISINYMLAKDSVKSRLDTGMSFTEFSYQLVQGYDFYWLWKNKNCKVQLGGSDQWGNIVTGTELIRRKGEGQAFAVTTPLIKKTDGGKFGKTENGNIWLDKTKTSPYKFTSICFFNKRSSYSKCLPFTFSSYKLCSSYNIPPLVRSS
jgi:tyrosyl-tRNA synthetase